MILSNLLIPLSIRVVIEYFEYSGTKVFMKGPIVHKLSGVIGLPVTILAKDLIKAHWESFWSY